MSKSILVIDMPKKCDGCVLHGTILGKQVCNAEIKRIKDVSIKPDWCPLKNVPEKINPPSQYPYLHRLIADGWNACIDTILKGADGNN